ncbi:MAG: hypothetical protein WCP39_05265 [Chlamydiota bacterium]
MQPIKLKTKKGISKLDPSEILLDKKFLISALLECFQDNDIDAFIEILDGYIATRNKSDLALKANISRNTLYDMLHRRKNLSPI